MRKETTITVLLVAALFCVAAVFVNNPAGSGGGGSGMAALEIMTNHPAIAGGIRVGLGTNVVFKYPPWALFSTNNTSSNSVEITVQLYRPFAVLDGTNIFYESSDWELVFNEEWFGDVTSVIADGNKGINYWQVSGGGTLPNPPGPIFENALAGIHTFAATQSNSGRELLASFSGATATMTCTNQELFFLARFNVFRTNVAGDLGTYRLGVTGGNSSRTEPADGIHIRTSTNANNAIELVTARASTVTINSFAAGLQQRGWTNVFWYLDRTGTNVVAGIGNHPTNLVSVITNVANIPNSVLVTPWVDIYRLVASAGNVGMTNQLDYIKIWRRRL